MRGGEWLEMTRFKRMLPVAGFVWVMIYFAYHAFTGDQGLPSLTIYHQREQVLVGRLAQLQNCRASFEKRIQLLNDHSLDLDYLEERAHTVLYLADVRDVILPLKATTEPEQQNGQNCSQ